MERQFYNAASLERVVGDMEREYGLSSEDFLEARNRGVVLPIPGFRQSVWASCYTELCEKRGGASSLLADALCRL